MPKWPYWHRLEYRREISKDTYVHAYTEVVEDHGWTFCHDPKRREQYLADYTHGCAADYLSRVAAKPGTWRVTVYRLGDTPQANGEHLCTIRMHWSASVS